MLIKKITSDKELLYYNFLAQNYGNIFNTLPWLKIFGNAVEIYGIYDKNGNLIGGFPLYKRKKLGITIYKNPPFTPYIGPFLEVKSHQPTKILSIWKKNLQLVANFLENLPYSVIMISLNKHIVDTQPFIWHKFKVTPRYTYVLNLEDTIENIYKRFSYKRRNDIRKAIKDGIEIIKTNELGLVKNLVLKTFFRQRKKINEYILGKILFEFASDKNSFAFVAFKKGIPISTAFCIYDKDTAYYLLGGYDFENKHHGAGALTLWECIKYSKGLGLKYFDFEGSMIPNIEKFFRDFGGELKPYYMISKAKFIFECILKFLKREVF